MSFRHTWFSPSVHDAWRSVEVVRVVTALVLISHPLHALFNLADVSDLAHRLETRGIPLGTGLAWAGVLAVLVGSVALLVPRLAGRAALSLLVVVGVGSLLLYAPRWFVLGGMAEEGEPGLEFSMLLVACLLAVWWANGAPSSNRESRAGVALQIFGAACAFALLVHGATPFVRFDFDGMREWGQGMEKLGYPCGVALVWSLKSLELVSAIARLARRLVVPACVGNLLVVVPGMWISQQGAWFVVGPGEGGIEFPVLITACSVATMWAYWPSGKNTQRSAPSNSTTFPNSSS